VIFWKIRNCFCAVRRRHSPSGRSTMADSLYARVYLAGVPAVAFGEGWWRWPESNRCPK